jgi:hypothetical protein
MATATATVSEQASSSPATLRLRPQDDEAKPMDEYRYTHLLPHFSVDRYPPLEPFDHVDPGHRALILPNPRAFLDNATSVVELTPHIGTEITGLNLAELDSSGRDQLALEVGNSKSCRAQKELNGMHNFTVRLLDVDCWSLWISKIFLIVDLTSTVNGEDISGGETNCCSLWVQMTDALFCTLKAYTSTQLRVILQATRRFI